MAKTMTLKYLEQIEFKRKLVEWIEQRFTNNNTFKTLFISLGNAETRCKVWSTTDVDLNKVIKRAMVYIDKSFSKSNASIEYIKLDLVQNIKEKEWGDVVTEIETQVHNNHFRKGISFDAQFGICLLEQEIYGRSVIRGVVYNEPNFIDEKNLKATLDKKYGKLTEKFDFKKIKKVYLFDTQSAIYEKQQFIELQTGGCQNGVRCIDENNNKDHIIQMIEKNAAFLHDQIKDNGRFIYGYFPAYNREIKSYNTVRHCTSLYALIETFEINKQEQYWFKIHQSIDYALTHFYKEPQLGTAYMIDGLDDEPEIKLGSNAAAILMLTKYQEITQDNRYQKYAESLAKGIQTMIDEQGETTHILNYPSLEIKDKFRIVYYDGEAALALLRLYQINKNTVLLDTVKLMFEHFISKNYDKYHDHWLSYCTNELTKICPEEKYFQFGLNNYLKHMDFIRNRQTVYATLLEMMMSAYKMLVRMEEQGFTELLKSAKFEELKELIQLRVEFQRNGFFYPEVAMYMQKPKNILHGFYVRHDRLRTRIDDQEHNLSGYVAYINYFDI